MTESTHADFIIAEAQESAAAFAAEDATVAAYKKCEAIADGMVLSLIVHGARPEAQAAAEFIRDEIRALIAEALR